MPRAILKYLTMQILVLQCPECSLLLFMTILMTISIGIAIGRDYGVHNCWCLLACKPEIILGSQCTPQMHFCSLPYIRITFQIKIKTRGQINRLFIHLQCSHILGKKQRLPIPLFEVWFIFWSLVDLYCFIFHFKIDPRTLTLLKRKSISFVVLLHKK